MANIVGLIGIALSTMLIFIFIALRVLEKKIHELEAKSIQLLILSQQGLKLHTDNLSLWKKHLEVDDESFR